MKDAENHQSSKMQTKTIMRYHFTTFWLVRIKTCRYWQECEENRTLILCWWEYERMQVLWKTVWYLVNDKVTIWPSNSTPRQIPKRNENMCPCRNLYVNVTLVFIIAKGRKQSTSPLTDDQISNMWHIHTVEYYLAIKKVKYYYLLQCRRTLKILHEVKKSHQKRTSTM